MATIGLNTKKLNPMQAKNIYSNLEKKKMKSENANCKNNMKNLN